MPLQVINSTNANSRGRTRGLRHRRLCPPHRSAVGSRGPHTPASSSMLWSRRCLNGGPLERPASCIISRGVGSQQMPRTQASSSTPIRMPTPMTRSCCMTFQTRKSVAAPPSPMAQIVTQPPVPAVASRAVSASPGRLPGQRLRSRKATRSWRFSSQSASFRQAMLCPSVSRLTSLSSGWPLSASLSR